MALCPVTRRHMMMCSNKITWKDDKIGLQSSTGRKKAVALGKNEKTRTLHSGSGKPMMQLAFPRQQPFQDMKSAAQKSWWHTLTEPLGQAKPSSVPLLFQSVYSVKSFQFTEETMCANKNLPRAGRYKILKWLKLRSKKGSRAFCTDAQTRLMILNQIGFAQRLHSPYER